MSAIRYVSRTDPDGWLNVKPEKGPNFALPYGVKVKVLETKAGREYFEILEGAEKGKKASVIVKAPGQSYLIANVTHSAPATVKFVLGTQSLSYGGSGPCNAFSGGGHRGFTAVSPGNYPLTIPPYPARMTRPAYSQWTRYHRMWFRIGTSTQGSRFLHPGVISDGCVTVRQFIYDPATKVPPPPGFEDLVPGAKTEPGLLGLPLPTKSSPVVGWDKIFEYLILCRLNDQCVGTLTVVA